jgi:UDP-N-acetylmuramyl pentapeptide phosphotransferase/UDP-N-acetylglucosamine-1-phosphate transferase
MELPLAFLFAFALSAILVLTRGRHLNMTGDSDLGAIQKVHGVSVPRIGGVAVFGSLAVSVVGAAVLGKVGVASGPLPLLLACSLPAFVAGLVEDVTKSVSPTVRLAMTMVSALLGYSLLAAGVAKTGVPFIDHLLQFDFIALPVTLVAVAGVSNSINLIDGYNGLASGVCCAILLAIGALAYFAGDTRMVEATLVCIAALLGFMAWNFPFGRIFLGDGGAYLSGFIVAELGLLLVIRDRISPWSVLLLVGYPVTETLFSIVRRRFITRTRAAEADAQHLHHLVNQWICAQPWSTDTRLGDLRNPLTTVVLWCFNVIAVVPSVCLRGDDKSTMVWLGGFVLGYGVLYCSLYKAATHGAGVAQRPWVEL